MGYKNNLRNEFWLNFRKYGTFGFHHLHYLMEFTFTTVIGLLAALCTTIAFLPQVIKTWKAKSARDLSLGMFSIFAIGVILWLIYGIRLGELPIIIANTVTLLLIIVLLYFKLTMDRPPRT